VGHNGGNFKSRGEEYTERLRGKKKIGERSVWQTENKLGGGIIGVNLRGAG